MMLKNPREFVMRAVLFCITQLKHKTDKAADCEELIINNERNVFVEKALAYFLFSQTSTFVPYDFSFSETGLSRD